MKNGDMPAIPLALDVWVDETGRQQVDDAHEGLTKREMFAMAAMQGMMSNSEVCCNKKEIATFAINQADALLKELEK